MGQTCFVYNKSYNAVTIILTRFNIILIIIAKFRKKQKGRLTFVKQPFLPSNKIHKNHKLIVNHRKYF